jgi:hypothetical protein
VQLSFIDPVAFDGSMKRAVYRRCMLLSHTKLGITRGLTFIIAFDMDAFDMDGLHIRSVHYPAVHRMQAAS